MMREELSEKVETVYAEEYAWPLGAALLLLAVEACIDEAPEKRKRRVSGSARAQPARGRRISKTEATATREGAKRARA
jgi:Ca-activated chloride channel family protein